MSGYKRAMIRISQEEYRRLHQADMQSRFASSRQLIKPDVLETDLTDYKRLARIEHQQDKFNDLVDQINGEIGTMEANYQNELLEQQSDFQNTLSDHINEIWHNEQALGQILFAFEERTRQEQQVQRSHLERTDQFINSQHETDLTKKELAEDWLARARTMGLFIRDNYDHDRFAPGQFEKLVREVNLGQRNLVQGVYESAINSAQTAYLKLSDLRVELDQRVFDWHSLFDMTWQAARSLFELIRENKSCNALDLEGQELPICLDLDFWSNGQYSLIVNKLREMIGILRSDHSTLTSSQLDDLLENQIPEIKHEFDAMVFRVRYCAINSQLRVNIADLAVHALKMQGFILDNNGYQDNDQRNRYITQLVNIEGSRITIQVDPVDDLETTNDIVLITEDISPKFQPEVRKRADLILRSLQNWGLHVGHLQTSPRIADPLTDTQINTNIPQGLPGHQISHNNRKDNGRAN
jgi:hypothetical protein